MSKECLEEGERIKALLRQKKISQKEFAERNRLNESYLSQIITGKKPLNLEWSMAISAGLGVPVEKFSPRWAKTISSAKTLVQNVVPATTLDGFRVPIVIISLDTTMEQLSKKLSNSEFAGFLNTQCHVSKNAFGLRVIDDSMSPRIKKGDVVIIETDIQPRPGDVVLAALENGKLILRNYKELPKKAFCLYPNRPDFATVSSLDETLSIKGVVVEQRTYFR